MNTILQLSDTHIVPEGTLATGGLDTAEVLARLVTRIQTLHNQLGPIHAVLVSGDLTDDGSAESYARFKQLIAPLQMPTFVIPGNHDARAPMRAAFADQFPDMGPLDWDRRIGDIHMIGLDSLVEGVELGTLAPASIDFLQAALQRADGSPVLLALHHPPFICGIDFMDEINLTNKDAFHDAVASYSGEIRIVCGHIHCTMIRTVVGQVAISAPAPGNSFAFDRPVDAPENFQTREDGCLLHRWDGGFQTIHI